jgi:hypothetical protein
MLLNKPCVLFGYFDYHDVWHVLSAVGVFFFFLVVYLLDLDLAQTPCSQIRVFWHNAAPCQITAVDNVRPDNTALSTAPCLFDGWRNFLCLLRQHFVHFTLCKYCYDHNCLNGSSQQANRITTTMPTPLQTQMAIWTGRLGPTSPCAMAVKSAAKLPMYTYNVVPGKIPNAVAREYWRNETSVIANP